MKTWQQQAIIEIAEQIRDKSFRVFIAESGTHGFYTNLTGTRIVSFQMSLEGITYTGNYKSSQPRQCGSGWRLDSDSIMGMFSQLPPRWATGGHSYKLTTLEQHLETYQSSSKYTEV